ncbi:MAG: hypothetical protein KJO08_04560 [Gammaproteobacteria bacterium]|nr:hypothetical protein [Gammaproteobacteria bacterium]
MMQSDQYPKIVEWSEEDRCYVGQCPGIIGPCCHGDDKSKVYSELCRIVDEWIEIAKQDAELSRPSIPAAGKPLSENRLGT